MLLPPGRGNYNRIYPNMQSRRAGRIVERNTIEDGGCCPGTAQRVGLPGVLSLCMAALAVSPLAAHSQSCYTVMSQGTANFADSPRSSPVPFPADFQAKGDTCFDACFDSACRWR